MYDFAKYARSLIREFGRKDEKPVALMWLNALSREPRDGYLDYFNQLLNRIYCPSSGLWQEYVHEHICRIFNTYPKLVFNQKYPAFSMESDPKICSNHIRLLSVELEKSKVEKETKALMLDIEKMKVVMSEIKSNSNKIICPKRIHAVNFEGNVVVRFANLDVPFTYNSCELKEDVAGAATAAILSWRSSNPLPEEKKEIPKSKSNEKYNDPYYYGFGSKNYYLEQD